MASVHFTRDPQGERVPGLGGDPMWASAHDGKVRGYQPSAIPRGLPTPGARSVTEQVCDMSALEKYEKWAVERESGVEYRPFLTVRTSSHGNAHRYLGRASGRVHHCLSPRQRRTWRTADGGRWPTTLRHDSFRIQKLQGPSDKDPPIFSVVPAHRGVA